MYLEKEMKSVTSIFIYKLNLYLNSTVTA